LLPRSNFSHPKKGNTTMNLREGKKHILADFVAGNCSVMQSDPGIGKTDVSLNVIWPAFKAMHPGKKVGLCRHFMAYRQDVDAAGIPYKGQITVGEGATARTFTVTDPSMPSWFISTEGIPASEYDIVLSILEEWGQASPDAKKAHTPIALEGGVDKWRLPVGSPRLILTNLDPRDGVTKEADFTINRWVQRPFHFDVTIWDEDFASKRYTYGGREWATMGITRAWAKQNSQVLVEKKPEKQGPWCTPRSLCALDRFTQAIAESNNGVIPVEDPHYMESAAGYVGMPATQSYVNTIRSALTLPSYEDIVGDPDNCEVPTKADLMMLLTFQLAGQCQPEHVGECIKYINRLKAKDMAITFVISLLQRDYKKVINDPAMQQFINKNAALLAVVEKFA
jgi:hypothetical protein